MKNTLRHQFPPYYFSGHSLSLLHINGMFFCSKLCEHFNLFCNWCSSSENLVLSSSYSGILLYVGLSVMLHLNVAERSVFIFGLVCNHRTCCAYDRSQVFVYWAGLLNPVTVHTLQMYKTMWYVQRTTWSWPFRNSGMYYECTLCVVILRDWLVDVFHCICC